jgi:hypothetical protein
MSGPQAEIIQLIEAYFAVQSEFDGEAMASFWHPAGKMYLVGNSNEFRIVSIEEQAGHIKETKERLPEINVQFVIDEIEQVSVHDDLIASAHVRWRMIFPEGYGKHRSFFNLAKIAGKWGIVNTVDRGFQVMPGE